MRDDMDSLARRLALGDTSVMRRLIQVTRRHGLHRAARKLEQQMWTTDVFLAARGTYFREAGTGRVHLIHPGTEALERVTTICLTCYEAGEMIKSSGNRGPDVSTICRWCIEAAERWCISAHRKLAELRHKYCRSEEDLAAAMLLDRVDRLVDWGER